MKKILSFLIVALTLLSSCRSSEDELLSKRILGLKKMAELGTVEYTIKKVIKADDNIDWYKYGERKILFSCTAFLKAGIDMAEFSPDDVIIDKTSKSISVTLPDAKLLSYNIPIELIQQEYCNITGLRKKYSPEEIHELKIQGEKSILEKVGSYGILDDARNNAKDFFEATFAQLGYENITVNFRQP